MDKWALTQKQCNGIAIMAFLTILLIFLASMFPPLVKQFPSPAAIIMTTVLAVVAIAILIGYLKVIKECRFFGWPSTS